MGQRGSPDTPGLKIFGPRGRGLDEMTFRVPPHFRGPPDFPENETQDTVLGGAAFHSPQLPSRWAQLRALGTDSEIPVGFVGADDSRRRNDSDSIGLSRNSPAAGVSLSLGPPWSTERMLLMGEGGPMPMDPRRGWWGSPVIKWGSGHLFRDNWSILLDPFSWSPLSLLCLPAPHSPHLMHSPTQHTQCRGSEECELGWQ